MKKKTIMVPSGILILVFLILAFSFGSSCGCLDPDEEFAAQIYLNNPSEITPQAVQRGFEKLLPIGTSLNINNLPEIGGDGNCIFEAKGKRYICTYYYESNVVAKRGYRVVIDLEKNGKIVKVRTAKISKWFGVEYSTL